MFGKNSPVRVICDGKRIGYELYLKDPEHISLVKRILKGEINFNFIEKLKLLDIDTYLDMPIARVIYEENPYKQIKIALENGITYSLKNINVQKLSYTNSINDNDLQSFLYLYENNCVLNDYDCRHIAEKGLIKFLKFLNEKGIIFDEDVGSGAAEGGHVECLKYLIDIKAPIDTETCTFASRRGHLECIKLLYDHGFQGNENSTRHANNVACLEYLHINNCPISNFASYIMSRDNKMECIEYLLKNNIGILRSAIHNTAKNGNIKMLQLFLTKYDLDDLTYYYATKYKQLEYIKFLKEIKCPWYHRALIVAADNNSIECLEFLNSYGYKCEKNVFEEFLFNKKIKELIYLIDHDCNFDERICDVAVLYNNVEILTILYNKGYLCDKLTSYIAKRVNSNECFNYLQEKGIIYDPHIIYEFDVNYNIEKSINIMTLLHCTPCEFMLDLPFYIP